MKVLIIGGTGVISSCIVEQLLAKGHNISIFHRGTTPLNYGGKVEEFIGDKQNSEEFERMMKNYQFDVVIDMICFTVEDAELTIGVFKNKVEQIIITSSVAAYRRPLNSLPIQEGQEALTYNKDFPYAFHKAEVERYANKMIEEEDIPITIIRPSLTYGERGKNLGILRQNYNIIDRIKKGKPLVMFGDGTGPMSFTFAPDLAKGYEAVLGNKNTYGKSYHITSEERRMWDDLYLEFGKLLGVEAKIVHIPSEILFSYDPNLFGHIYYEKMYAGIYDNGKIKRDCPQLKMDMTLSDGLTMMLNWYEKSNAVVDEEKDQLEDRLVYLYEKLRNGFKE
ncbi:NAD-dependent epimerase/dehydratase family protein [Evansella sp. AB-P1]|uniref:NAD-dependent epimerase/dehydratase family protein n=1 Tax=Evansella sp. AB-P1 TaxID=3037653 RepID=UPI00241C1241|nr:NAD-dependent epimerase/dehydratase family protein [Evansella sp. AB-P1]MDG5789042.1 NAD-dependent epimerase/dehydratase family protein [Evansella sp. AB-P1]